MYEELVYLRWAELRREADEARRRSVARADRARPRATERAARRLRSGLLHRPAVAAGCQA